jgi:DNA-binding Xre family transcriptional regulator
MAKKWSELRAAMSPESQARADEKAEVMLVAIELRDLLRDRGFTQDQLAEQLELAQGNVSRMLRRTDMHVSTLREVIEAMGGSLEIVARFPDRDYRIDQLTPAAG